MLLVRERVYRPKINLGRTSLANARLVDSLGDFGMNIKPATGYNLALLLLVLPGCSRLYHFDGVIVDGDGAPIAGATVTLYPHDWDRPSQLGGDGESDEDGKFEATWGNAVGVEYFNMVITADGYRESELLVAADRKNLRIVLQRNRKPTDSPAGSDS